jgi:hypothetical protein
MEPTFNGLDASLGNLASQDYVERVYAGILGKIIGVYLGRPFEGWTHQRIQAELGEIWYYVNERLNVPLVVVMTICRVLSPLFAPLPIMAFSARSARNRSAVRGLTTSSRTKVFCGGAALETRPNTPPSYGSSPEYRRPGAARSP